MTTDWDVIIMGGGLAGLSLAIQLARTRSQTRILVLDVPFEDRVLELGLVADRVFEVASFSPDQIGAAPDIGRIDTGRLKPHPDFARAGHRRRHLAKGEHIGGRARALIPDRLHAKTPSVTACRGRRRRR